MSFRNGSANRYLVKEYTISSADTWQKITITDLADNTGTWATDNTTGLDIRWCLWEGGFSAPADTWGTGNIIGSSSNVNWATSTDNNFYLTGVSLEIGQNPTSFEHEPFERTLAKCQRYFQNVENGNLRGARNTGNRLRISAPFPVTMRATPTIARVSGVDVSFQIDGNSVSSSSTSSAQSATAGTTFLAFDLDSFNSPADRTFMGSATGLNIAFTADAEL